MFHRAGWCLFRQHGVTCKEADENRRLPNGWRMSSKKNERFWDKVLEAVREVVSGEQFETWFTKTSCAAIHDDEIVVEVPSKFYSEWLRRQYLEVIKEAVERVRGVNGASINFQIAAVAHAGAGDPSPRMAALPRRSSTRDRAGQDRDRLPLNPQYTLENFVVGASNRLAHAASLAVIEDTGRVYNPLFLYGGVGLGKTHLLQGICHAVRKQQPDVRIRYIPCEQFVNQFIAALGKNRLEEFREQHRRLDILVIDDIHFLASKDHTQEEFFHTFNALYNNQKQIILSSDSAPKDIPTLEDRLVSRFKWGLVCEIEPPTFETRMAIVLKKARLYGVEVPDDVVEFIASAIQVNVRELEGAVTRFLGFARIMKRSLSLETAKEALGELVSSAQRRVTIVRIVDLVTEHFDVRLGDLQSKKRNHSIALPRQVCMYLARKYTKLSLAEIGGFFGGRDHSTVIYAVDKIDQLKKNDIELRSSLQSLERRLEP